MCSISRKFKRSQLKKAITIFQQDNGINDARLAGLCHMLNKEVTLHGKWETVLELEIRALEQRIAKQEQQTKEDELNGEETN